MNRLVQCIVVASLAAGLTGCCASPYRTWQNGWGFNDARADRYGGGPPPPVTTPPGPTMPVKLPAIP